MTERRKTLHLAPGIADQRHGVPVDGPKSMSPPNGTVEVLDIPPKDAKSDATDWKKAAHEHNTRRHAIAESQPDATGIRDKIARAKQAGPKSAENKPVHAHAEDAETPVEGATSLESGLSSNGKKQTTDIATEKWSKPTVGGVVGSTDNRAGEHKPQFPQRWKPGKSGNPAGRPAGSKNKFTQQFVDAFTEHFAVHGQAAIEEVHGKDVGAYLKIYASIMPKQLEVAAITETRRADDLTDDELAAIATGGNVIQIEGTSAPKNEVVEEAISNPKASATPKGEHSDDKPKGKRD